jgi:integrase
MRKSQSETKKLRIGKPTGKRRSFRILVEESGRFKTLKHPDLTAINLNLKLGRVSLDEAERAVKDLAKSLGPRERVQNLHKDNRAILERYWKEEYQHRDLVDPKTAYYELERAILAAGNNSLQSASREALQKHVNSNYAGNYQRRVVSKLNQLLKWLGRDFKLLKVKEQLEDVKHLTEQEFKRLLPALPAGPLRVLHEVCFYGGFRIGEAFALEPHLFNQATNAVKVLKQVDKAGVKRQTKTRKQREAFVLPEGHEALVEWFKVKDLVDLQTRQRMSKITKAACKKVFPGEPSKHITFHDLRHSYAIHLLGLGASISLVAMAIGDSPRVAEKHYIGYTLTSDSLLLLTKLIHGRSKK